MFSISAQPARIMSWRRRRSRPAPRRRCRPSGDRSPVRASASRGRSAEISWRTSPPMRGHRSSPPWEPICASSRLPASGWYHASSTSVLGGRRRRPWLLEAVVVPCNRAIRLDYDRSFKGVAGVVLALAIEGDLVVGARAAVTWAFPRPCCADLPIEQPTPIATLSGRAGMLARAWAAALPEPTTDHLASGGYRRRIIEVHLRRALERAARGGAA